MRHARMDVPSIFEQVDLRPPDPGTGSSSALSGTLAVGRCLGLLAWDTNYSYEVCTCFMGVIAITEYGVRSTE